MQRLLLVLFFAAALWMPAPASAQKPAMHQQPRLIAAVFDSSTCGPCRILTPKFDSVMTEFQDAPIMVVRFEDGLFARGKEAAKAKSLGITDVYLEHRGRKGGIVLMSADTRAVLESVGYLYTEDDIRSALREALARTARKPRR